MPGINKKNEIATETTTVLPSAIAPMELRWNGVICADLESKDSQAGLFENRAIHYALARDLLDAMHIVAARISAEGYFSTIALDEHSLDSLKRKIQRVPLSPAQTFVDGHNC